MAVKNFILLFEEKEGTSALVRLLAHFEQLCVLRQVGDRGWEPFDAHNCGPMPTRRLVRCLDLVYGEPDMAQLNRLYTRTGKHALIDIDAGRAVGFKMRFRPPAAAAAKTWRQPLLARLARRMRARRERAYRRAMLELFRRRDVTVFLVVRQDVLRWGLSKYHGDGGGRKGHLQFRLAAGAVSRDQIPKIEVDCTRLETVIRECERSHAGKRRLLQDLQAAGIAAHPLRYEDFVADQHAYLARFFSLLGLGVPDPAVRSAIAAGAGLEKVHGDDISGFVTNHAEVLARFGDRYAAWPDARADR